MDRVAKAEGDFFGRELFHTKSPQDLIAFVEAFLWFEEEAGKLVHA
jgi:hypothetical protein